MAEPGTPANADSSVAAVVGPDNISKFYDRSSLISVSVRTIAGELLELAVHADGEVGDVKEAIARSWHVSRSFQTLVCGDQVLGDAETIDTYCSTTADAPVEPGAADEVGLAAIAAPTPAPQRSLVLTMVLSLDAHWLDLESRQPPRQIQAIRELGTLGTRGGGLALASVGARLEDSNRYVRRAAVQALGQLAKRGDPEAIAVVSPRLRHDQGVVREAAVTAIALVASVGDQQVISAVRRCLAEDEESPVRKSALESLGKLAHRGDRGAIEAAYAHLDYEKWHVRRAAIQALGRLSERGDPRIVAAISGRLEDKHRDVRWTAVQMLGEVADKGDPIAIQQAMVCLDHPGEGVRAGALQALGSLAEPCSGDCPMAAAVAARLTDEDAEVRRTAVRTLGVLVERGDQTAVSLVVGRLKDDDEGVRVAALLSLGRLAVRGDCAVVTAVSARLEDSFWDVRCAAVRVLGEIAPRGNEHALVSVSGRLEHESGGVRGAAWEAMQLIQQEEVKEFRLAGSWLYDDRTRSDGSSRSASEEPAVQRCRVNWDDVRCAWLLEETWSDGTQAKGCLRPLGGWLQGELFLSESSSKGDCTSSAGLSGQMSCTSSAFSASAETSTDRAIGFCQGLGTSLGHIRLRRGIKTAVRNLMAPGQTEWGPDGFAFPAPVSCAPVLPPSDTDTKNPQTDD